MADINKLRELGKPRYAKEEEYYNEIIGKIEEKMLEVAPYDDSVRVIFIKPGYTYGCCCSTPDNLVIVNTNKFMRFDKYLYRIEAKYKEEGFGIQKVVLGLKGYSLSISWEE